MNATLTPALLLSAYAQGFFPMARGRHAAGVEWYFPEERGIIPLEDFHVPKSLAKIARKQPYRITMNENFRSVITACADAPREDGGTWINDEIIDAYCALRALGHAHSVEVWDTTFPPPLRGRIKEGGGAAGNNIADVSPAITTPHPSLPLKGGGYKLVGGLYGVSLRRAFFGESMFSLAPNASKLALVYLVEWLCANNYVLLDTQYVNDHLQQFGVRAIPRAEYLGKLKAAIFQI